MKDLFLIFNKDQVITDPKQVTLYCRDWRGRYEGSALAVVFPSSVSQIQQLLKLCNAKNIKVIPQGGNTSLCGASVPLAFSQDSQIIINFKNLNQIVSLDKENSTIVVESGCVLKQLHQYVESHDLYFPLSMASESTLQIGGAIATNAGGIHVIKYGMMKELVLGLEVVLPNGEVLNNLKALYKNNINFDIKQLFIGSEGTLGIITKAVLRLYPKPYSYLTAMMEIDNLSLAINLLNDLKRSGKLAAFEIIGKNAINTYNKFFLNKVELSTKWLVLFELETTKFDDGVEEVQEIIQANSLEMAHLNIALDSATRNKLWQVRENIPLAEKKLGLAIKHDISLPISAIDEFIKVNESNLYNQFKDITIIVFGHLGDGNLHYNVVLNSTENLSMNEFLNLESKVNEIVYTDLQRFKGSFSAEHGIGQLKRSLYKKYTDTESYSISRGIKNLIDPKNILNPLKMY